MAASFWPHGKSLPERSGLLMMGANAGRVVAGAGVIETCLYLGNVLQRSLHIPAPGSVLGMTILLMLLQTRVVPDDWIRTPSTWLLLLLPACFVPIYVALISDPTFWHRDCMTLLSAAIIGAAIMLSIAGWLARRIQQR